MEALVRQYERPVFNAALRMLGNRDDAADVTQTTFLKAFQNLAQYNPAYRFFSWIYRIAINESIDTLGKRARSTSLSAPQAADDPAVEAQVGAAQVSDEVQGALLELSEDYRSVIVLRYFTGCSYQEMAEVLRIPEKTVKSRLYSARQKLRSALQTRGVVSS